LPGLGANEVLIFDLVTLSAQRLRAKRAPDCAAHRGGEGEAPVAPPESLDVEFTSLALAVAEGYTLVDVRDTRERDADPMPAPSLHLPMSRLLADAASLDAGRRYLLVCASGKRSGAAADLLRSQGLHACRSLRGGLKGLKVSA